MSDLIINTVEEMKDMLANHIADDSKRPAPRKFKLAAWRDGLTRLIELSEHGFELIDYEIASFGAKTILVEGWKKNRWGEAVGRKTAAQIAKLLGYNLTVEIAQAIVKDEKDERNKARNSINYYHKEIMEAEREFAEYLVKRYPGNLPGLPRGVTCQVVISFVDEEGNQYRPEDLEPEA